MRYLILLTSLIASTAWAGDGMDVQNLQRQIDFFAQINQAAEAAGCASTDPSLHLLPSCAALSDNFCEALWNPSHNGSLLTFDGAIKQGKAPSGLRAVARADYEALVAGWPKMPADLKTALAAPVASLKKLLAHETADADWSDHLDEAWQEINDNSQKVAQDRVKAAFPNTTLETASPEERFLRRQTGDSAYDDLLIAKYQDSENWHRVEKVFYQARADVATSIGGLNLPPEVKKAMIQKVSTVELTLPKKKYSAEEDCGTTQVNGFYMPNWHKFTICAGMFNSFQTESALYGVISHEISHSVDPSTFALDRWTRESNVAKALAKLDGGPGLACDDWKKAVKQIDASANQPVNRTLPVLDNFYNCLQPRSDLDPFSLTAITAAAQQICRQSMASLATREVFRALGDTSAKQVGGKNPYFLQPDQVSFGFFREQKLPGKGGGVEAPEIFAQDLRCKSASVNGKAVFYSDLPQEKQPAFFREALLDTQRLLKEKDLDQYRYCGESCRDLASLNLSLNPQENFADWMSFHAVNLRLARLPAEKRKEAALLSNADLCDAHGPKNESASEFAELERKYSGETHPDNRVRRVSSFTRDVAAQAGCEMDGDSKKGFAACEIK